MDRVMCGFWSTPSSQRMVENLCGALKVLLNAHSVSRGRMNWAGVKLGSDETASRNSWDWSRSHQRTEDGLK
jgi:hypothetical protein